MELVCFLVGDGQLPIYRTLALNESQILRALLGSGFEFELREGEPMDELLFQVLAGSGMGATFFFSPPEGASVLGTFEVLDAAILDPRPAQRSPKPRVH